MGTVYEAEHIATGRRVALKMLEQQLDSQGMRQRFLREGRLADIAPTILDIMGIAQPAEMTGQSLIKG